MKFWNVYAVLLCMLRCLCVELTFGKSKENYGSFAQDFNN